MARRFIRDIREAGPLPLMALEHALAGVSAADLIRLADAGMLAVFSAAGSDELFASRPAIEMGLEVVRVVAKDARPADQGRASADAA